MCGQIVSLEMGLYIMTKVSKFLAALLLTVSPFFAAHAADVYRYSDPLFPAKRLTLRVSDKQFTVADMAEDLYVCGKESKFHCVRSATFKFEIPRAIQNRQRNWMVDGRTYQVEAIEKYSLRGATEELMRIREENAAGSSIYLYSLKRGLVGIGFVHPDDRTYSTYLLEGNCGFGASEVCPSTSEVLDH